MEGDDAGNGAAGDGGGSMAVWFVIPFQTVWASLDVIPDGPNVRGLSVSLPSSGEGSSEIGSASSSTGESGEGIRVSPFHIVAFSRAPRPR